VNIQKKVVGYNRVKNKLRGLVASNPPPANKIIRRWLKKLRARLKKEKYPPKLPNQKYVRTGNLANRWAATANTIGNTAPYARWVVNEGTQAAIHAGRWWTMQEIFERYRPELVAEITRAYVNKWEK